MIDGYHKNFLVSFVGFRFSNVYLLNEDICLVSVTIQYSKVENTDSMHFFDIKLMRA